MIKSYVKQFIALATGNTAEATAVRNQRLMESGLKAQISQLEGELVKLEMALEQAKENSKNALYNNGKQIENSQEVIDTLIKCKNIEMENQDQLDSCKEMIAFLKEKLEEVSADEK